MQKNGADIILQALLNSGVDTVFGYPGGAALHLYDAIHRSGKIKHVLFCHEQAAVHAAEGYARSTGKIGVVILTSGPGATNGVTGIADAMLDSTPLLIITSQVLSHLIGTDAFQEADVVGITKPITKHNEVVMSTEEIYSKVINGIKIATSGRQGPVLLDIPKDFQGKLIDFNPANEESNIIANNHFTDISESDIKKAVELMQQARRPLFYCGGGVVSSGEFAVEKLRELVKKSKFPITTTLMGLGCFPPEDEQSLHMVGMHGSYEANLAMYEADLLIAIGVRFDDRVTAKLASFSPNSKKIHIDIDGKEINKNVKVDLGILADCGVVVDKILQKFDKSESDLSDWWHRIEKWRSQDCFKYNQQEGSDIKAEFALDRLYELTKTRDIYFTTDVGQHQMWAAQYLKTDKPRHFITSGGLGTMGYGFPAAIGAKIANPNSDVVCITGEGSFMMNMQELATVARYRLPVKIMMLNNNYLGMVRQWQEMFYDSRYTEVDFEQITPDFVALAAAFGIKARFVDSVKEVDSGIAEMMEANEPYFLIVKTERSGNVYPMIAPGCGHNEILLNKNE